MPFTTVQQVYKIFSESTSTLATLRDRTVDSTMQGAIKSAFFVRLKPSTDGFEEVTAYDPHEYRRHEIYLSLVVQGTGKYASSISMMRITRSEEISAFFRDLTGKPFIAEEAPPLEEIQNTKVSLYTKTGEDGTMLEGILYRIADPKES